MAFWPLTSILSVERDLSVIFFGLSNLLSVKSSIPLHSTSNYGHNYAENIGNSLVKLLNDGHSEVQIAAAVNLGKVCIAISNPNQPRLSLTKSEDSSS